MPKSKAGACVAVANGGVGETGASLFLLFKSKAKIQKLMVLKNVKSSLCPNTGAVAMLVVNGNPVAFGDITQVGSSIQTPGTVKSGDVVVAIVHTVPNFKKNISCIRLGELSVELRECDLV
jgi:hypothetical protein